MFENQTLNKNRVLPSAMILDRLSIECIAKAATKEKIIESCCISSTKLVEQLVKSEPLNAECEVFGIWLQLRAVVLRITLSYQMN